MIGLARLADRLRPPAAKPGPALDIEALEREIYRELYGIRSGNVSREPRPTKPVRRRQRMREAA